MPFLLIFFLIFIHEVGHFLMAFLFGFTIDKIYLYPYGGISKFNLEMNVDLKKELVVLFMGPIFQILGYCFIMHFSFFSSYHEMIQTIHYSILFFNFLPIYPLDGGKLINILFGYKLNFRRSFRCAIFLSYITVFLLFLYYIKTSLSLNVVFMLSFLIYKITIENRNENTYYNKFLLERHLNSCHFKRYKKIHSIDDFYRNCSHIIQVGDRFLTEKECLAKKFNTKY
ncbi:MAG: hypothetical protein HFJ38_01185 [Bacilli bacterium]|nr:hypothetical protein [Bacilli bacterium]